MSNARKNESRKCPISENYLLPIYHISNIYYAAYNMPQDFASDRRSIFFV